MGILAIVFALFGAGYLVRAFARALSNGFSPGRLGAVHASGSVEYMVFLAACLLGIAFTGVLFFLGLRWAALSGGGRD